MRARSDAQRQLQDDLRAAVGPETFAAMSRAADPDLRTLDSIVARLNLTAAPPRKSPPRGTVLRPSPSESTATLPRLPHSGAPSFRISAIGRSLRS
ncbi:MAG: hypothetical protein EXS38_06245 [Opitutus sp.]|nr:hypothetical protein [Opitutus sp.]